MHPIVIWGMDDKAAETVAGFIAHISGAGSAETPCFWAFSSRAPEPLSDLKTKILSIRDELKSRNEALPLGIVLFACAAAPDSLKHLDLLEPLSRMLTLTMPGSQSITLVVLFPPQTAGDDAKQECFRYFQKLEGLAGEIPFLRLIWVNQLTRPCFENPSGSECGLDGLYELLQRQLQDADLNPTIVGIGYKSIENLDNTAGRKNAYSKLGAFSLINETDVCRRYLEARFQKQVFDSAYFNWEALLKKHESLSSIQARADHFMAGQLNALDVIMQDHKPTLVQPRPIMPAEPPLPRSTPNKKTTKQQQPQVDVDHLQKIPIQLSHQVEAILKETAVLFKQATIEDANSFRDAFCDFLNESPERFAGAKMFLKALLGEYLLPQKINAEKPKSGLFFFSEAACAAPLIKAIEAFAEPYRKDFPPSLKTEPSALSAKSWIFDLFGSPARISQDGKTRQLQLVHALLSPFIPYITRDTYRMSETTALLAQLEAAFQKEFASLVDQVKENRDLEKAQAEELKSLFKALGFWGRNVTRRAVYKTKLEAVRNRINRLKAELEEMQSRLVVFQDIFLQLMNRLMLPHIIRVIINERLGTDIQKAAQEFDGFLDQINSALATKWEQAGRIAKRRTATSETILNQQMLALLYKKHVTEEEIDSFPEKIIRFLPPGLNDEQIRQVSYYPCKELKDHYHAGPPPFLERLDDFAGDFFQPVAEMHILDMLEVEGKETVKKLFESSLARLDQYLEFSPGMLPLAMQNQVLRKMLVVRTDQALHDRLASHYGLFFNAETVFIADGNPQQIDLTALVFGFPAFLVHGLAECRDLAANQAGESLQDLWPLQSTQN